MFQLFALQTSDVRSSQRKRHSTAPKSPSSQTKYSINNSLRRPHDPSLNTTSTVPLELGPPRNRRYQNIAWVRGQHPVSAKQQQSYQNHHFSIHTAADPQTIESSSIVDGQRLHRHTTKTAQPTSMSVRPIYNPSVYRINRIKPPPIETSKSPTTTDNPSAQELKSVDSQPQTSGKYKWLSS